ncbi:MAG: ribonuclease P protein component [Firmicutes bacterium]|nr:ribonuclease P protein component [Bacillota bacterium]
MLRREHRLSKGREYAEVYRAGRAYSGGPLRLYVSGAERGKKAGVVVSKKIGGAVERNRVRRLISEAVRAMLPEVADGTRLVFVARPAARGAGFSEVRRAVGELLDEAGVLACREVGDDGR